MGFFGGSKKTEPKETEQPKIEEPVKQEQPKKEVPKKEVPKAEPVVAPTIEEPVKQQEEQQEVFNLSEQLNALKFWNTPEYKQYKQVVIKDVLIPGAQFYDDAPYIMHDFKRDYILGSFSSQNQRSFVLGLSTILITMGSMRVSKGLRKTIRNTVFGYFGVGLFIVPEIYNPFLTVKNEKKE